MNILTDVLNFVLHWYHAAGFLLGIGYTFRSGWQKLGATEHLVREALKLSPENSAQADAAIAIRKTQRAAIVQMRMCMLAAAGILWIMLS